eukprot:6184930-Pleurochrysis_carterae.AAC.8
MLAGFALGTPPESYEQGRSGDLFVACVNTVGSVTGSAARADARIGHRGCGVSDSGRRADYP